MSFLDTLKTKYDTVNQNGATDDSSKSRLLSKLDDKTSKELQDTIQKNAELIQELKVIVI